MTDNNKVAIKFIKKVNISSVKTGEPFYTTEAQAQRYVAGGIALRWEDTYYGRIEGMIEARFDELKGLIESGLAPKKATAPKPVAEEPKAVAEPVAQKATAPKATATKAPKAPNNGAIKG